MTDFISLLVLLYSHYHLQAHRCFSTVTSLELSLTVHKKGAFCWEKAQSIWVFVKPPNFPDDYMSLEHKCHDYVTVTQETPKPV